MEPFDFKNRRHLTMGVILFLSVVTIFIVIVRISFIEENEERRQLEWYSKQLRYAFVTKVDTVINLKQRWGYGEIYLIDPKGQFDLTIEDSLNATMDSKIRFITPEYGGRFKFIIQNSQKFLSGDSLYVNSKENQILFFRDGQLISTNQISWSLTDHRFQ